MFRFWQSVTHAGGLLRSASQVRSRARARNQDHTRPEQRPCEACLTGRPVRPCCRRHGWFVLGYARKPGPGRRLRDRPGQLSWYPVARGGLPDGCHEHRAAASCAPSAEACHRADDGPPIVAHDAQRPDMTCLPDPA
jgi:hypothetical protein